MSDEDDIKAEQQKKSYKGLLKVVFTKSSSTTYTYYNYDRVKYIEHIEQDDSYIANILLDNSDNVLTDIDLQGYTATISWGVRTTSDLYKARAPLSVLYQSFSSSGGVLLCSLTCIGVLDKLRQEAASEDYLPPATDISDLVGAVKTQAEIGASEVELKNFEDEVVIPDNTKLTIAGDSTEYLITSTVTTDTSGEATVSISPTLVVQAHVNDVATLALDTLKDIVIGLLSGTNYGYSLYGAISISWESEDSIIDSFVIKDYFKLREGSSRLAKVNEALGYTTMVKLVKDDGIIYFKVPTISGAVFDSEYVISGGHTFFAKSYSTALVVPNFIQVKDPDETFELIKVAQNAVGVANLLKVVIYVLPVTTGAESQAIADAMLQRAELAAQRGDIEVPMNAYQKVWDYVQITDAREGGSIRTGNVQYIRRTWDWRTGRFRMVIRFGNSTVGLPNARTGTSQTSTSQTEPSRIGGFVTYNQFSLSLLEIIALIEALTEDALDDDARLDAIEGDYLPLAGGTMTGTINTVDLIPVATNASDLGSDSLEYALGYIKKTYIDTRLQIPGGAEGTDLYD